MAEPFVSTTRLPELTQQLAAGNAMSPIYIAPEDALRVLLLNVHPTAEYVFTGRLLRPDGATIPLLQQLRKTTDGTEAVTVIDLTEGYFLSGAIIPMTEVPQRGECYAQMALIRGGSLPVPAFAILTSGYVTSLEPLTWPWGTRTEGMLSPPGFQEVITGDGAVSGVFSRTVPARRAWYVKSIACNLASSATAGDRFIRLFFFKVSTVIFGANSTLPQTAGVTHSYSFGIGLFPSEITVSTHHVLTLPNELILLPGTTVQLDIPPGLGGDQIVSVVMTLESFAYYGP